MLIAAYAITAICTVGLLAFFAWLANDIVDGRIVAWFKRGKSCPRCKSSKRGDFCGTCGVALTPPGKAVLRVAIGRGEDEFGRVSSPADKPRRVPADWIAERSRRLQAIADGRGGYPMSSPAPPPKMLTTTQYTTSISSAVVVGKWEVAQ